MKSATIGLIICTALIIVGAVLKIMHIPYGGLIIFIGFIAGGIFEMRHTYLLQKRIKELEKKLAEKKE